MFDLTWHTYTDHLREMLHGMMTSDELTDVTLVAEDKKHYKAHKVVLSASSTVYKNIHNDNDSSNPIIYLRGILSNEIESILRIDEIPNVEKSHEAKEISKDIELDDCIQLQSSEFEKVCVLPSSHSDPQQLNENVAPGQRAIK